MSTTPPDDLNNDTVDPSPTRRYLWYERSGSGSRWELGWDGARFFAELTDPDRPSQDTSFDGASSLDELWSQMEPYVEDWGEGLPAHLHAQLELDATGLTTAPAASGEWAWPRHRVAIHSASVWRDGDPWIEVGWDKTEGTFYLQHCAPSPTDPTDVEVDIDHDRAWTIGELNDRIGGPLPPSVIRALRYDINGTESFRAPVWREEYGRRSDFNPASTVSPQSSGWEINWTTQDGDSYWFVGWDQAQGRVFAQRGEPEAMEHPPGEHWGMWRILEENLLEPGEDVIERLATIIGRPVPMDRANRLQAEIAANPTEPGNNLIHLDGATVDGAAGALNEPAGASPLEQRFGEDRPATLTATDRTDAESSPERRYLWYEPGGSGSWWELGWDGARFFADFRSYDNDASIEASRRKLERKPNLDDLWSSMKRYSRATALPARLRGQLETESDAAGPAATPGGDGRPEWASYRVDVGVEPALDDGAHAGPPTRFHHDRWVEVGWDKTAGTFYAHTSWFEENLAGQQEQVVEFDAAVGRIATVDQLRDVIDRPIPTAVAEALLADAEAHPFDPGPRLGDHDPATDVAFDDSEPRPDRLHRWDDPDGSWWTIGYSHDWGGYLATKLTVNDAGEEIIVDDVGYDDERVTDMADLVAQMNRNLPAALRMDLEADRLNPPTLEDPGAVERPMGTRYRLDVDSDSWWEVGWDKPLGTFYAQRFIAVADIDEDGGTIESSELVTSHGDDLGEISTIEQLGMAIGRPIPLEVAHDLAADATAHPFESAPRFYDLAARTAAPQLPLAPAPPGGRSVADDRDQLAQWASGLHSWEARLAGWQQSLEAQAAVMPAWSLPAEPVVEAVRNLHAEIGEGDVAGFASSLGLDEQLVDDLLNNETPDHLDVDRIAHVCEALSCSPYDLWGAEQAQRILHVYGPERWPAHIEPLSEGREPATPGDAFLPRRVAAELPEVVADSATTSPTGPAGSAVLPTDGASPVTVTATCYRQIALLAVDPLGDSRVLADPGDAGPGEDLHFAFRQIMQPRQIALDEPSTVGSLSTGGPAPGLVEEANRFRGLPWLPDVGVVRFVAETGAETWLGWNPQAGAWEEWDDPRGHYPGAPGEVLDPGGFTDPRPAGLAGGVLPDDQLAPRPAETLPGRGGGRAGPIEMHERHDPNVDHTVELVEAIEIDAGVVERIEDRSPSLGMDL